MKNNYDIIIIGAGIAGLSLGALLAAETDFNVLILEKNPHLGGRVRVQKKDGFLFDWGIHASLFGDKSKINEILGRAGKRVDIINAGAVLAKEGKFTNLLGRDIPSTIFGSRLALSDLVAMARIFREFRRDRRKFISMSVDEGITRYGISQRSADILKAITIGLLVNADFKQASFYELISFILACVRKRKAMGYPRGGWSQTLNKLEGVIDSAKKITLLNSLPAEKILFKDKKVTSVRTKEKTFYANKVACALPPQFIIRDRLIEKNILSKNFQKKMERTKETLGLIMDYGLKKKISEEDRIIFSLKPPSLAWFVSNISPEVAPPEKQLLTFFSPLKEENFEDNEYIEKLKKEIIKFYTSYFPGIEENTEVKREFTSVIDGAELNLNQTIDKRVPIKCPEIEGLYFIGDAVGVPGIGSEMSINSALKVFELF